MKNIKKSLISLAVLLTATLFFVEPAIALSQVANPSSTSASINNIGSCGTSSTQYQTNVNKLPSSGQVYVKLSNQQETTGPVDLYFQSNTTLVCQLIGTASPVFGSWVPIGSLPAGSSGGGFLIADGDGLGAFPYSSVLSVLITSAPNICNPSLSCTVSYQGYSADIEPTIITHATDQVAVYTISPITGSGYNKVSYYDNGKYLYGSTKLLPFNRNYLNGGVHKVDSQVTLNDGQTLDINQNIDMGNDITDMLYLKSKVYQSKNKAVLVVILLAFISIVIALLIFIHWLYKRHRFVVDHGIDKAPSHIDERKQEEENIVVGKFN